MNDIMKYFLRLLLFVSMVILSGSHGNTQNVWSQKSNFGGIGRIGAAGFVIGGKLYAGTGRNGTTLLNDFWEYDPVSDLWTQKASFPGTARVAAVGFSVGSKGYIGLGSDGFPVYNFPTDFWEYNPLTDSWSQAPSFPGKGRYTASSFVLAGKGYVTTGWDWITTPYFKDLWEFNPVTGNWTQKSDLAGLARQSAFGFAIGNKGYVGGGHNGISLSDFWEYNPVSDSWTQKQGIPSPARYSPASFVIGSKGYVGTGGDGSTFFSDFHYYDPNINSWTQVANITGPFRQHCVSFAIDSCGYVTTGVISSINTSTRDTRSFCPNCSLVANISGKDTICEGDSVLLTAGGGLFYQWSGGGINANTASVTVGPSITTTYQVVVSDTNCVQSAVSHTVFVKPLPQAHFSYQVYCDSVCFSNLSANGAFAYWDFGDGGTDSQWNPCHRYNTPGTYNVALKIYSQNCGSDSIIIPVTIKARPQASFTAIYDSCSLKIDLVNTSTNASAYSWNFGDGNVSNAINPSHTYVTPGVYLITLFAGSSGCADDTLAIQFNFFALPIAGFLASSTNCNGTVSFLNQSINGSTFQWDFGDNSFSNSVNPAHNYSIPGSYTVKLVVKSDKCGSDSIEQLVLVPKKPVADFSYSIDICQNVGFVNLSADANIFYWNFGDGSFSNNMNAVNQYLNPGAYNVSLISVSGSCSDTIVKVVQIDEDNFGNIFIPNVFTPNFDGLNDVYQLQGTSGCGDFSFMIFNRWGQLIYENTTGIVKWDGTYAGSYVPEGVYFYRISSLRYVRNGTITLIR
jgi:gliding motility-associated-like protein